jgi:hypothetical protein
MLQKTKFAISDPLLMFIGLPKAQVRSASGRSALVVDRGAMNTFSRSLTLFSNALDFVKFAHWQQMELDFN